MCRDQKILRRKLSEKGETGGASGSENLGADKKVSLVRGRSSTQELFLSFCSITGMVNGCDTSDTSIYFFSSIRPLMLIEPKENTGKNRKREVRNRNISDLPSLHPLQYCQEVRRGLVHPITTNIRSQQWHTSK